VTEFARRGAGHVTGLDIAPNMIKLARDVVAHDGTAAQCDFVVSDILDWKTGGTYDVTIAIGFWDYIMEPPERLRKIRAITRPGGTFLSAWPRFWTWRMPVRKVRLEYIRGCPVYFFRKPQVVAMIEGAGFEVVGTETVGKLHCVEARAV
jgi:SAM-dependent methyltransferase